MVFRQPVPSLEFLNVLSIFEDRTSDFEARMSKQLIFARNFVDTLSRH